MFKNLIEKTINIVIHRVAWLSSVRIVMLLIKFRITDETLIYFFVRVKKSKKKTVNRYKVFTLFLLKAGGDNVKSSWLLYTGLHACYNGDNKAKQKCKF
jgi:hypothetical protein